MNGYEVSEMEENESGLFDYEEQSYQHLEEGREQDRITVYHAVCNESGYVFPYHDFMLLYDQFKSSDSFRLMVEIAGLEAAKKLKEQDDVARNSNGILNGNQ